MDNKQQLPQLETYNVVDQNIKEALDLDLNECPRLKSGTVAPVLIHKRQQAKKKDRSIMVNAAIKWGWQVPVITYKIWQEMAQTAFGLVVFDCGFVKPSIVTSSLVDSIIGWLL